MRVPMLRSFRILGLLAPAAFLSAQVADFGGSYVYPADQIPVPYSAAGERNAVSVLRGLEGLPFDPEKGYLLPVLEKLGIPISSQTLVFSKTSFQAPLIHPRAPRALYFNDDVYVGWVPGSDVLEISVADPVRGGVFYTLAQRRGQRLTLRRADECLQCHASPRTLGVPGHMVRSVYPAPDGFPHTNIGSFVTDHRTPFEQRFGGWYVTGSHGSMRHLGNTFAPDEEQPDKVDRESGANVASLTSRFDVSAYPSPHSDIVALMVLEHQTTGHNYITRVNYETRNALKAQETINALTNEPDAPWSDSTRRRVHGAVEALLSYFLFAGETPLPEPVTGTSAFTGDFRATGPADQDGRSLREFDLKTRLFRHRCSFLIYSPAMNELPAVVQELFYSRLRVVLRGEDDSGRYAYLPKSERRAILGILAGTHPAFRASMVR